MDNDDIVESGGDIDGTEFYDEEFDSLIDTSDDSNIKPELKKIYQQHPECILDYVESVVPKIPLKVVGGDNETYDPNHITYPFITLYEKTKIIGLRANQLSRGAKPFISVPEHVTDVRDIARLELEQKRLPFIIKRPLPNGTFEFWRLVDLMIL